MLKHLTFHKLLILSILTLFCFSCGDNSKISSKEKSKELAEIFDHYWQERMKLLPLESTGIGDTQYNDLMPVTISEQYRDTLSAFYQKYLTQSEKMEASLSEEDKESKELFEYELKLNLEGLKYPGHLMPINQFWSFTLDFPQLGSGSGNQPFKTPKDYQNFLVRMQKFPAFVDQAIVNMRKGVETGYVLPKVLAVKMIPQIKQVLTTDATKSIFFEPVKNIPVHFSAEDKLKFKNAYQFEINNSIIPSYYKLKTYLEKDYLPHCRETFGISSVPEGSAYYQYLIKQHTTTTLSPDSIYQLGLKEVARLKAEMEKVKTEVGFTGSLKEFFVFMNQDKQFYPFKNAKEVLDSFKAIQNVINPKLSSMFETIPKTKFEIRQTEAFRAASASAEYNAGSEDGTRPGIFYVPIIDATKFNIIGMETLFLHEAIPGHHFQISLQQENKALPKFRKFLSSSAYAEGWALYTETLGRQLGLYTNPYQYFGHLSDAMHRAIRLVVDVSIHTKGMSREAAIQYMMDNERISEEEATAEIERYMAIPAQALSYKIGQLTILSWKEKYERELGSKFKLSSFHKQILDGGDMPLQVLEKKLELWAKSL